ncbi:MAG: efflux RND transporter periplasmic adaptor subunit, partial [Candidatus Eisenbacteria bacterium]
RAGLVRLPVTAPGAGVVIRRAVSTGSQVGEGTELFAVVPDGGMVFEAHVPAREAGEVAPGQRARIAGEDGSTVAATVRRKLPLTAAGDQNALVWLAPDRAAPPAWLDRFASATVEIGAAHRSLAVPDAALVEDDLTGETRVARLIPSGRVVWVTVRLGSSEDGWHELLTPALAAGTRVVIEGQHGLPDSTRVTAAP